MENVFYIYFLALHDIYFFELKKLKRYELDAHPNAKET